MIKLWSGAALSLVLTACATLPADALPFGESFTAATPEDVHPVWQNITGGIDAAAFTIESPRLEAWALRIDLTHPAVEIAVNAGNAHSGVVSSLKVDSFLHKYDCFAALNGGPFAPVSAREGELRLISGIFIADYTPVAPPAPRYDALVFYRNGRGAVVRQRDLVQNTANIRHAIGGFFTVLAGGTVSAAPERTARHPRSAAGLSAGGKTLYLLAIDGRRRGSKGATEFETGLILSALGAVDGINLDGGGSTALAVRRKNGTAVIVNKPSHGLLRKGSRAVATCIGIRIVPGQ
ncbi:MAG: phosphodiester glycosidase family protein [Spirochaetaceae bacterium]|nr:phosphodiester glycosidase family protein [Spirochaetaceae bacterium]